MFFCKALRNKHWIVTMNLSQPGILGAPRVIHCHWSLGESVNWVFVVRDNFTLKRWIPSRQRCKTSFYARPQMFRWLNVSMTFRRQTKFLQRLTINLKSVGLRCVADTHFNGKFLVGHISHFIISAFLRYFFVPKCSIGFICFKLSRIRFTAT